MAEGKKELRLLVRMGEATLDGKKPIYQELRKVKGVSFMLSNAVLHKLEIDKAAITGELSDDIIDKLERTLKQPEGIPKWLLNRQADPESGEDKHLIASDLNYVKENDIKRLRRIKTYRGLRHAAKLPLRGQRTKSHFRNKSKKSSGIKGKK